MATTNQRPKTSFYYPNFEILAALGKFIADVGHLAIVGGDWDMEPQVLEESRVPDNLKMKVLHGCGDLGSCVAGKTSSLIEYFLVSRDLSDVAM